VGIGIAVCILAGMAILLRIAIEKNRLTERYAYLKAAMKRQDDLRTQQQLELAEAEAQEDDLPDEDLPVTATANDARPTSVHTRPSSSDKPAAPRPVKV